MVILIEAIRKNAVLRGTKKTTNWSPVQRKCLHKFTEGDNIFDVNIMLCRRPAPRHDAAAVPLDVHVLRPDGSFRPALSVDRRKHATRLQACVKAPCGSNDQ